MIQFDRVDLSLGGHVLFENASFVLQKGEKCGLVGRNGSGKSSLIRLICGELEPQKGIISVAKGYKIGYLRQHIHFTASSLIEEAALALPPQDQESLYKAEKVLFGLGFTQSDLNRPCSSFSGGYHLRLHLAKALIGEPDCLLLDEPTNYLDILSIRWLEGFLQKWRGECLLISHDRAFMDAISTHTLGIHREKVRKMKGGTIPFFEQILLEEEAYEQSRQKLEKKRAQIESFVERFGAKATKAKQAQSKLKALEREPTLEKLNQLSHLSFSFPEATFKARRVAKADHLHFSFTQWPLIEDFSLEIEKGEKIAFIGKNGRGKSTLLRLLSNELQAQSGSMSFSEKTEIGVFGQTHVARLNPNHTIEQAIHSANPLLNTAEIKAIAGKMLFSGPLAEKPISVLSGGEKSRVLLGQILARPCNFLLLDEPTHHLDIESIEALIDALEDFSGALIIVTHSELILRRLALDKIVLFSAKGQSLFLGSYDDFLEKAGWEEEQKLPAERSKRVEERRAKAEIIAKRSAALKPLTEEISELEKRLTALEQEQKKELAFLEQQLPSSIKSYGVRQKQIEVLENRLYTLYDLYETTKRSFDNS